MKRAVAVGIALGVALVLSGCQIPEIVGSNDVALYYDGDRRDIVDECLKRMTSGAGAPVGEPTEVRDIAIASTIVDDARSTHELTAALVVDGQHHTWMCRVAQRYTMLDVREQTFTVG
jgi:hypothetical protein